MAPNFTYSNPYTQQKHSASSSNTSFSTSVLLNITTTSSDDSLSSVLDDLQVATNASTIQRLQQQLTTDQEWGWAYIVQFLDWVRQLVTNGGQHAVSAMQLLTQVAEDSWNDEQFYAASINSDDDGVLLLDLLTKLAFEEPKELAQMAFVSLMTIWRALARLQRLLVNKNDVAWWMVTLTENRETLAVQRCLERLLDTHDDLSRVDSTFPPVESLQTAAVSFLVQLLQHERGDWLLSLATERQEVLKNRLETIVDRLNDTNMPATSFTRLSLVSLQLLLLLENATGGRLAARVMEALQHVVRAVVSTGSPMGPRWTNSSSSLGLRRWTLPVLQTWTSVDSTETNKMMSLYGGDVLRNLWQSVLEGRAKPAQWQLLQFCMQNGRTWARQDLRAALMAESTAQAKDTSMCSTLSSLSSNTDDDCTGRLLQRLLEGIRSEPTTLHAAAVTRYLLQDRRSPVTDDDLSHQLWEALDGDWVRHLVEAGCNLKPSTFETSHARLLCLLDTMHLLLTLQPSLVDNLLTNMPSHTVEALVNIMDPKEVRVDHLGMDVNEAGSDESTPPVNNLSRLDDRTVCIQETERRARGMEPAIRMCAATVLAFLSQHRLNNSTDSRTTILQGRMADGVAGFINNLQLSPTSSIAPHASMDMTLRRLRLLSTFGSATNEDYLASMLFSFDVLQRRTTQKLEERSKEQQRVIEEYRNRAQSLEADKEKLHQQLSAQAIGFQRQKGQLQRSAAQNAKQLAEVHQVEVSKVERRSEELKRHLRTSEGRMLDAERAAEASRMAEMECMAALKSTRCKLQEIQESEQEAKRRADECSEKLNRYSQELQAAKSKLGRMVENEKKMRDHINQQDAALSNMDESERTMRDSLENLFSDLVSLAQLYEKKEKEESSSRESDQAVIDKLRRKLDEERSRYSRLEDKYRQTASDNNMLSRKFARAQEKLDKAREQRNREPGADGRKRSGHASYLDQLHQSTVSEKHGSFRTSSRSEGKENGSVSSSSHSQRQGSTSLHRSRKYR